MAKAVLRILGALLCGLGCSSQPEAIESSEGAINNGLADTGDLAVVLVRLGKSGTCTGSLVSPHVVLTAGHCVEGESSWRVFFGSDTKQAANEFVPVIKAVVNPGFTEHANANIGHDSAVLIMQRAAPAGVTPLRVNHKPIDMSLVGEPVHIVGFGRSSPTQKSSVKLQGTGTFDRYTSQSLHFPAAAQHECPGDSGGPAIMPIDGVESIVGTVSFHTTLCEVGWYSRTDTVADWVDGFIQMADGVGQIPGADAGPQTRADGSADGGAGTRGDRAGPRPDGGASADSRAIDGSVSSNSDARDIDASDAAAGAAKNREAGSIDGRMPPAGRTDVGDLATGRTDAGRDAGRVVGGDCSYATGGGEVAAVPLALTMGLVLALWARRRPARRWSRATSARRR